ncbi:MAG TPA: Maf family nucleotide pyrophosphatase [Bacteroidales bacterium]|nr:Maf family nucleotide pyrophosphatase [Bacteroidales bacterium]HRZ76895.1 Maf family nucleotide pyrophosphatase [Bacteroidales bacterium]
MNTIEKLNTCDIILGSGSPRRLQLLEGMGLRFRIMAFDVDETLPAGLAPALAAEALAQHKAQAFPQEEMLPHTLLITADTLVVLGEQVLGKPTDRQDAIAMLSHLSGHTHEVITGVCLRTLTRVHTFHALSRVTFRALAQEEIVHYVDHYRPFDKAGAYGIQEWIGYVGVERMEGSYYNVMGLPTQRLWEELCRILSQAEGR